MSLITSDINAWPSANATEVARWDSWEDAKKWMQEDKANRLVEGLCFPQKNIRLCEP